MEHRNQQAKALRDAKRELEDIEEQINLLKARRQEVAARIERLKNATGQSNSFRGKEYYDRDNFEWSKKLIETCDKVFHIKAFRSLQRAAINATMSGVDCLLIMPTGGGKSLTFQLPSVISSGITVVVSPLIALMEDQQMGLRDLNIETSLFNAQTTKEESRDIMRAMVDPSSCLKLIYVTPEKLAKSKSIMSQMEKMYSMGRFSRLVIDEVHCCSQWGHDFRTDYKFLGIMKNQFPDVPILGLTATATPEVVIDIQKILNIEGCLVLKDSFYRPNLKYEIIHSHSKNDSAALADVIKTRFKGQSGIIYCLTVKETEDLAEKLCQENLRASAYNSLPSPSGWVSIRWTFDLLFTILCPNQ
uniref:DNA 3'-5' helicase n=1 Tax=Tetranychus urticae TaxID=32264 RepID=T1KLN7_TETUR